MQVGFDILREDGSVILPSRKKGRQKRGLQRRGNWSDLDAARGPSAQLDGAGSRKATLGSFIWTGE